MFDMRVNPACLICGIHPHIKHASLQSTNIYVHADMALKERALARTTPANVRPGRFRPTDKLLAFLQSL